MNREIENRIVSALFSRGIGRFVIAELLRERGGHAARLMRAGGGESAAVEYLAGYARHARENLQRHRRERAAQLAALAVEIRGDCQRAAAQVAKLLRA